VAIGSANQPTGLYMAGVVVGVVKQSFSARSLSRIDSLRCLDPASTNRVAMIFVSHVVASGKNDPS